ncbi:MAG: manganese efflux pump MntP family protein [Candidatus Avispirillum sp.]
MELDLLFFLNSALLGVALAMDAFSVSLANGLSETNMKRRRMCAIAGVYAAFQAAMPLMGWVCVHTVVNAFKSFERLIPWIALTLLSYIGIKMILDGVRHKDGGEKPRKLTVTVLLLQGLATSIDALSVGFAIPDYGFLKAVIYVLIIAAVTFVICMAGLAIGKKFGTFLSNKAEILGGVILLGIGIEIFLTGILK